MTISAANVSQALHAGFHHTRPSATRSQPFAQQLRAAQQSAATGSRANPTEPAGEMLSADMLQAVQTIG